MVAYGLACLLVCVLTLWDRQARPWAITIALGWVAGFAGADYWPLVSFALVGCTLVMMLKDRTRWGVAIHVLAVMMLALDFWYQQSLLNGLYVGEEYAWWLNRGLEAQLVLIGHRGGWNVWLGVRSWCSSGLFRDARRGAGLGSTREEAP